MMLLPAAAPPPASLAMLTHRSSTGQAVTGPAVAEPVFRGELRRAAENKGQPAEPLRNEQKPAPTQQALDRAPRDENQWDESPHDGDAGNVDAPPDGQRHELAAQQPDAADLVMNQVFALTDVTPMASGAPAAVGVPDAAADPMHTSSSLPTDVESAAQPVAPKAAMSVAPVAVVAANGMEAKPETTSNSTLADSTAAPAVPSSGAAAATELRDLAGSANQPQRDPEAAMRSAVLPPPAAPRSSADDSGENINAARVARSLQNAVHQNGGTVTLRLTPADMGTVRIQMHIQGTSVSARFFAETDAARATLMQQLPQLRQSLEGHGLMVDRLQVQSMQQATPAHASAGQQQQSSHDRNDATPGDGRSRGSFAGEHGRQSHSGERQTGRENDRHAAFAGFMNHSGL